MSLVEATRRLLISEFLRDAVDAGMANCYQCRINMDDGRQVIVTIQVQGGESPLDLYYKMKRERDALQAVVSGNEAATVVELLAENDRLRAEARREVAARDSAEYKLSNLLSGAAFDEEK